MLSTLVPASSALVATALRPVVSQFVRGFAAASDDTKIDVEVTPFKAHRIDAPGNQVTATRKELMDYLRSMSIMRRMEIALDMLYKAKELRGFCHLYDGQEAVICGIEAAANYKDSIITSYRDHCTHVARGGPPKEVIAELMGKLDGAVKGIGGSMHMYIKANNFYGGCGIVGAQIPLGAGLALAHQYRKEPNVAFTLYGDGAANQGQKYEALNMAALWNLPIIFVCENNHYGMGTAEWRAAKAPTFYTRGDYVPGIKCDGMDVLAVKHAMAFAKDFVLKNGPIIVECDTYRYHGHSMSDPGSTYRSRDEIATMRQERDPIERVKKYLRQHNLAEDAEITKIEKEAKKEIDKAVEEARKSPAPPGSLTWTNIYGKPDGLTLRGRDVTQIHEALAEEWTPRKEVKSGQFYPL